MEGGGIHELIPQPGRLWLTMSIGLEQTLGGERIGRFRPVAHPGRTHSWLVLIYHGGRINAVFRINVGVFVEFVDGLGGHGHAGGAHRTG